MKLIFVTLGLVFLSEVTGFRLGCSLPCGPKCAPASSCGHYSGCGLEHEENMCARSFSSCTPMVVRPHELPKAATSAAAAALSLSPVPGPCLYKKVIVKPAVLPKPVCRPTGTQSFVDSCHSHHHSYNYQSASLTGTADCHSVLSPGFAGAASCAENQANCAPADAVSLALAYKMAKERNCLDEDRLAFGFRKIPAELPSRPIIRNNVPEEKIFALNGQIVELKPISYGCRRSLEDEAAEDLLALEAEDAEDIDVGHNHEGVRRISLGEIGYRPAKLVSPTFEDITASTAIATDASHNLACSCGTTKCTMIPGDIEYRTVPKPEQICLPPLPVPDSCESGELPEIDQEPEGCTCSCVPIVMKKCHHCHKKSSVTIQKLLS